MRVFVIGDVHGLLDELMQLVHELDPQGGDRFAFLGDLVDKGPDSLGVLRYVRSLVMTFSGSVCIAGNHEESALRLKVKADKAETWEGLRKAEKEPWLLEANDDDYAFLRSLPLIARPLPGVILVHGGMFPAFFERHEQIGDVPVEWHRGGGKRMNRMRRFLRIRHIHRETGAMVALGDEGEDTQPWQDWYDGREGFAFYGHAPQKGGEVARSKYAIGVDTGAVFGANLTAAIIRPGMPFYDPGIMSVPAARAYCDWLEDFEA
jgi:hypothetical protein